MNVQISPELVFNAVMLLVDGIIVYLAFRLRRRLACLLLPILGMAIALTAACLLSRREGFLFFRLCAWGGFLHGPVLCLGCAVPAWISSRIVSVLLVLCTVLLGLGAVDGFLVEPEWLQVRRYAGKEAIRTGKLHRRVRIVVVADIQAERIGAYEKKALAAAVEEEPDLLLFAGDYLQVEDTAAWHRERKAFRSVLHATLADLPVAPRFGLYAVRGNVDPQEWADLFQGFPVTCVDETRSFDLGDGIELVCLSRKDSLDPRLELPPSKGFRIVLGHFPDFAQSPRAMGDLLVAGHTHGGQVRLPGLPPLFTLSSVPRAWADGRTDLEGGRTLVVSRGIGLERGKAPRLRLFCRPEITVIEVEPEGP